MFTYYDEDSVNIMICQWINWVKLLGMNCARLNIMTKEVTFDETKRLIIVIIMYLLNKRKAIGMCHMFLGIEAEAG